MTHFRTDKDKGFRHDAFEEALERADEDVRDPFFDDYANASEYVEANGKEDKWPRTPGSSDSGGPYDGLIKPKDVPVWTSPPSSDAEKALYYGAHIHSESNPIGLHTHVPGGALSGGHSHGPQNRLGVHSHTESKTLDGKHVHKSNHSDGKHDHCPENFA